MRSWLMRTIAASAVAASRGPACLSSGTLKLLASRNGSIHSKPHSSGRTTRFSSRMVSRVSHSYIQRAYLSLNIASVQVYQCQGENEDDRGTERCHGSHILVGL